MAERATGARFSEAWPAAASAARDPRLARLLARHLRQMLISAAPDSYQARGSAGITPTRRIATIQTSSRVEALTYAASWSRMFQLCPIRRSKPPKHWLTSHVRSSSICSARGLKTVSTSTSRARPTPASSTAGSGLASRGPSRSTRSAPRTEQARNLVIEGDNLQAMATLYRERGQVDLILTDPPYNTGNDLRYNDNGTKTPTTPASASGSARTTAHGTPSGCGSCGRGCR